MLGGYWGTLLGAPVTWLERVRCTGHMLWWTYHNALSLLRDLTTACKIVLLRSRAVRDLLTAVKHR
jgi:hypothetical protein